MTLLKDEKFIREKLHDIIEHVHVMKVRLAMTVIVLKLKTEALQK